MFYNSQLDISRKIFTKQWVQFWCKQMMEISSFLFQGYRQDTYDQILGYFGV